MSLLYTFLLENATHVPSLYNIVVLDTDWPVQHWACVYIKTWIIRHC